jgi:hypothetical protein
MEQYVVFCYYYYYYYYCCISHNTKFIVPRATIRTHLWSSQFYVNTEWQQSLGFLMQYETKMKSFFLCLYPDVNENSEAGKERTSIY